jgi:PBP1b-binding outer membrane lipoprotein LpoB
MRGLRRSHFFHVYQQLDKITSRFHSLNQVNEPNIKNKFTKQTKLNQNSKYISLNRYFHKISYSAKYLDYNYTFFVYFRKTCQGGGDWTNSTI